MGEDNEEEDPKCSRKKKPKLSLKADSKEDGEERDDEMVSISFTTTREHGVLPKCSIAVKGAGSAPSYVTSGADSVTLCITLSKLNASPSVCHCRHGTMGILNNSTPSSW